MEKKFIGIDVSKDTLDVCVLTGEQQHSFVIKNDKRDISKLIKSYMPKDEQCYIGLENTGKYSWLLVEMLISRDQTLYLLNPLHLKKSLGLVRGKNDKIDAIRIAKFIKKNYEELNPFIAIRDVVFKLKILLRERNYRVKMKKQLMVKIKDSKLIGDKELEREIAKQNKKLIKELEEQIRALEKKISEIIKQDSHLSELQRILSSIPGVGQVLIWTLIDKTNEFKMIKTPRQLACYAGVAPFERRSGTSVFGKNGVSVYADKKLKSLLHLSAMAAVKQESDFKVYYERKVAEGKNKMSVLNAVRNKIIHVVYALIKNKTIYQNRLVMS